MIDLEELRKVGTCVFLAAEREVAADISRHIMGAATEIEQIRAALTKLSNEVLGSLPLMEPLARREFGNTNYSILIQRAEEARALLKAH